MKLKIVYIALLFLILSCKLNKEIDLDLPPYQPKTVVECYLESGKPYGMLITKSISYFDSLNPIQKNIFISIVHNGKTDTLEYHKIPRIDTLGFKIYFHTSPTIVDNDYLNPYSLYIKDEDGTIITGNTTLMKPVNIDTISYTYSKKLKENVSIAVKFNNDSLIENYYRLLIIKHGVQIHKKNTDDLFTDQNLKTSKMVANIFNRFDKNDTIVITLAHISKEFYEFTKSVKAAERANGNPFVQPAAIKSNITGNAIGIFTGFNYVRDTIIIK